MNFFWLIYFAVINIATFSAFALDKRKAAKHQRRIPEDRLLLFSFFGGSPGALFAMWLYHHKTRKNSFKIKMLCVLLAQALIVYLSLLILHE